MLNVCESMLLVDEDKSDDASGAVGGTVVVVAAAAVLVGVVAAPAPDAPDARAAPAAPATPAAPAASVKVSLLLLTGASSPPADDGAFVGIVARAVIPANNKITPTYAAKMKLPVASRRRPVTVGPSRLPTVAMVYV